MAPVDHLFNSHKVCDSKWCWIKEKCESRDHTYCKFDWCKYGKRVGEPTSYCLPCDAGILHPPPFSPKKKGQTQITRIDTDLEFYDPNSTQGATFEEVDVEDCSPQ